MNSADQTNNEIEKVESEKPKKKLHHDWHGASIALFFGILGVVGARLGYLWIGFDVISQFEFQSIMLAAAAVLGLAVPRYKGLVTSIFFVIFVTAYGMWPHVASAIRAPSVTAIAGEHNLKVASFNTLYTNQDNAGIVTSVLNMNADVTTLIEMGVNKNQVLEALKSNYPYQAGCQANDECEMAIISKFPLTNIVSKGMWVGSPLIQATVDIGNGPITILGVHTTRFPHFRAQFTQVKELIKYVETIHGHVVMMGDFNSTPFSRVNKTISVALGFKRLTNLPTWPATFNFSQFAIDHIFVSSGIRAASGEQIGDNAGSDHYPVTLTLGIADK